MNGLKFLIAVGVLVSTVTTTQFQITLNYECNLGDKEWCVKTDVYEKDYITDDYLGSFHKCIDKTNAANPSRLITWDNGDGAFDNFYELLGLVHHNCTSDGKYKTLKIKDNEVSTDTLIAYLTWNYNLFDAGYTDEELGLVPNIR